MSLREKIKSRKFWVAVAIFTVFYPTITTLLEFWWEYGFDFDAFRTEFPNNKIYLFVGLKIFVGFLVGFLVALTSLKEKNQKRLDESK